MSQPRPDSLETAVAAGFLAAQEAHRSLLQATVETARAIFAAEAASVFLLDQESNELVFEAVAGHGSDQLVGRRFPAATGIAGTVLVTGEPLLLDDVSRDPRFGKDAAASTGYIPTSVMAVPLLAGERAIGVLEVLDRRERSRAPLEEIELLGLFGIQAGLALELLRRSRQAGVAAEASGGNAALLTRLAASLSRLDENETEDVRQILAGLDALLARG